MTAATLELPLTVVDAQVAERCTSTVCVVIERWEAGRRTRTRPIVITCSRCAGHRSDGHLVTAFHTMRVGRETYTWTDSDRTLVVRHTPRGRR